MEQKKYRVKRGGWGGFFLFLFGILCGIIIVGLVGLWAYKTVSISKVEKWFNVNIDLGSANGVKEMTIQEMATLGFRYANNVNSITLKDIEDDFGITISSPISGISLESIKNYPILEIKDHLDDITDQITLSRVSTWFSVDLPDGIPLLDDNMDVPVMDAIQNVFNVVNKGIDMTMADLQSFGIDLSSISLLSDVNDNVKLSELQDVVMEKKVGDLIEITSTSSAILQAIANIQINQLSTELPNLTIGTVIGSDATTGIIGKIKNIKIGELNEATIMTQVQSLTLDEVLTISSDNKILYELRNTTIEDLPTAIDGLEISVILGTDNKVYQLIASKNTDPVTLAGFATAIANVFDMDNLTLGDLEILDDSLNIPPEQENTTVKAVIEAYLATL